MLLLFTILVCILPSLHHVTLKNSKIPASGSMISLINNYIDLWHYYALVRDTIYMIKFALFKSGL